MKKLLTGILLTAIFTGLYGFGTYVAYNLTGNDNSTVLENPDKESSVYLYTNTTENITAKDIKRVAETVQLPDSVTAKHSGYKLESFIVVYVPKKGAPELFNCKENNLSSAAIEKIKTAAAGDKILLDQFKLKADGKEEMVHVAPSIYTIIE